MCNALKALNHKQLVELCALQQKNLLILRRKVSNATKRHQWSAEDIKQITLMLSGGASVTDVAIFFSVQPNAVYAICQRKKIRIRRLQAEARHSDNKLAIEPLKLVVNG